MIGDPLTDAQVAELRRRFAEATSKPLRYRYVIYRRGKPVTVKHLPLPLTARARLRLGHWRNVVAIWLARMRIYAYARGGDG